MTATGEPFRNPERPDLADCVNGTVKSRNLRTSHYGQCAPKSLILLPIISHELSKLLAHLPGLYYIVVHDDTGSGKGA